MDGIALNDRYHLKNATNFVFKVIEVRKVTVLLLGPKENRILVSEETLKANYEKES